jgi:hypothetical protein
LRVLALDTALELRHGHPLLGQALGLGGARLPALELLPCQVVLQGFCLGGP